MCCINEVYATHGLGTEEEMMNSTVLIRDESEQEEKIWVGKVPCCSVVL